MAQINFSIFKALIIEDSEFLRRTIRKYMIECGFQEVREAGNGQEGLEQLRHGPDIIVCDIEMEPINGFEFLKLLREQEGEVSKTPVLFLTGSAQKEDVHKAIELGVNGYVVKPVTPENLKKKLTDVLNRAMSSP
ncbi:MAG: response regulator [Alphaproteobacteria bacterium]|nr:response regulator [Alphaproteobacteria bacterium]